MSARGAQRPLHSRGRTTHESKSVRVCTVQYLWSLCVRESGGRRKRRRKGEKERVRESVGYVVSGSGVAEVFPGA